MSQTDQPSATLPICLVLCAPFVSGTPLSVHRAARPRVTPRPAALCSQVAALCSPASWRPAARCCFDVAAVVVPILVASVGGDAALAALCAVVRYAERRGGRRAGPRAHPGRADNLVRLWERGGTAKRRRVDGGAKPRDPGPQSPLRGKPRRNCPGGLGNRYHAQHLTLLELGLEPRTFVPQRSWAKRISPSISKRR